MSQGTFWVTSVAGHHGSELCIMPTAGGHDIRPNHPLNEHMRLYGLQSDLQYVKQCISILRNRKLCYVSKLKYLKVRSDY